MNTTKHLLTSIQRAIVLSVLMGIGSRCTQQAVDKQAEGPCRITQIEAKDIVTGNEIMSDDNSEQTVYEYDAVGKVVHKKYSYTQRWTRQPTNLYSYSTDDSFDYDPSGYLTKRTSTSQYKSTLGGATETGSSAARTTFTYQNGRLNQQISLTTRQDGLETKFIKSYIYDNQGALISRTEETTYPTIPASVTQKPDFPEGTVLRWTFQNGQTVDYTEKQGGVEIHPFTFQNGLVQSITRGNHRTVYTYDNQASSSRVESWDTGRLFNYTNYTYSSIKPPTSPDDDVNFKGFPVVANTPQRLWNSFTTNGLSGTGNFVKATIFQAQYKQNAAGYLQSSVETVTNFQTDYGNIAYQLTTTRTYTYNGSCD